MRPSTPDSFQRPPGGISLPTSPLPPPSGSARHPAGRRLMTLCLPSNRLFDNAPAHLIRTALPGVATGSEECDAAHTHTHTHSRARRRVWENGQGWPGHWEPLIFIHDREKVLVCWHRLLHLHSVIDCLPQRGSFVYLQIDEPVPLTLSPCHPLMLPSQENSSKLDGERRGAWKRILAPLCDGFLAVNIRNRLGNTQATLRTWGGGAVNWFFSTLEMEQSLKNTENII